MKTAILMIFTALFLNAMDWHDSYAEALNVSKATNKPMLVFLERENPPCRWCKKMKKTTFMDANISALVQKHFVALKVDKYATNYPTHMIESQMVPAVFFIKPDETFLMKPVLGYWNAENFMVDMRRAIRFLDK